MDKKRHILLAEDLNESCFSNKNLINIKKGDTPMFINMVLKNKYLKKISNFR